MIVFFYILITVIFVGCHILEKRLKSERHKRRISRIEIPCALSYIVLTVFVLVSSHQKDIRLQQKDAELQSLLSDIEFCSDVGTTGILPYQVVVISADSEGNLMCVLADANVAKVAMGIYEGIDEKVRLKGEITNPNWNSATRPTWKTGDKLFLSETAGEMENRPAKDTPGNIIQHLGYVISIDENGARIRFEPGMTVTIL